MPKIVDPDLLLRGTEIIFDISTPSARTIRLVQTGNMDAGGATLQAVFSRCKDLWRSEADLIKVPFPFGSDGAIFEEKFDLKNDWNWFDNTTRYLIRDAGWSIRDSSNNLLESWAGIVSLGTIGSTDQVYFQQQASGATTNFQLTGAVNQAVQVFKSGTGAFDYRNYLKLFVRRQGKTYAQAALTDIGLTAIDYRRVSFPLSNATDPKIVATDTTIDGSAPYTGMSITYLAGTGFTIWASGANYVVNSVVQYSNGRWYRSTSNHTASAGNNPTAGGSPWVAYAGERQIGTSYYAYSVAINGNSGTAEQIYEFVQRQLRRSTDIDAGTGTVTGLTADPLLRFVGDNLLTTAGVFIDNYLGADINRIGFIDVTGVQRDFPYTAAGTIQLSSTLAADADAKFWLFFTDLPGTADYGTGGAVIVNDATGTPITGLVSGRTSISFSFAYDTNTQGGRTASTDAPVIAVALGASTASYISNSATLTRSTANVIALQAAQERNYSNP